MYNRIQDPRYTNNYRDLIAKSTTIIKARTNYFWIDSEEYYSWQCLLTASNVIHRQIPKEFNVGDKANSFVYLPKCPGYSFEGKTIVETFKHTFYYKN
jgi:hypothetical protein